MLHKTLEVDVGNVLRRVEGEIIRGNMSKKCPDLALFCTILYWIDPNTLYSRKHTHLLLAINRLQTV